MANSDLFNQFQSNRKWMRDEMGNARNMDLPNLSDA